MNKLAGKPFALLGVSTNAYPPGKLKEVMERERMNWRSFAEKDGLNARWNNPATPTYYLPDERGTIRRKWAGYPGESALDSVVERLLRMNPESGTGR